MKKIQFFKISYWITASLLIAFLFQNSFPVFWNAWLIALFLLPAAFMVKYGFEKAKNFTGFKKWIRYFFILMISLYWGYIAITLAYWYFLELRADTLENILINPIFIWLIIGFFVLLDFVIFKKENESESNIVSIHSNRKKTSIVIDNIAYIESRDNYTTVVLKDGSQYKNAIKISAWETRLTKFLRIHRSFLVNPDSATLKGNEVIVHAKWSLPISRSYKKHIVAHFS